MCLTMIVSYLALFLMCKHTLQYVFKHFQTISQHPSVKRSPCSSVMLLVCWASWAGKWWQPLRTRRCIPKYKRLHEWSWMCLLFSGDGSGNANSWRAMKFLADQHLWQLSQIFDTVFTRFRLGPARFSSIIQLTLSLFPFPSAKARQAWQC